MAEIDDTDGDGEPVEIFSDDQHLVLVQDAEAYVDKQFILEITDGDGAEFAIHLDGIQVGDIIADARDAGLPAQWPYIDGIPRSTEGRKKSE